MYTAIHRAQPLRRNFQLSYVTGEGNEATLHVKMATSGQAGAVYRAVTERHAFYCCETVRTDVTEQFIRDLKVIIMLRENFAVQLCSGVVLTLHFIMPVFCGRHEFYKLRKTFKSVSLSSTRAMFSYLWRKLLFWLSTTYSRKICIGPDEIMKLVAVRCKCLV